MTKVNSRTVTNIIFYTEGFNKKIIIVKFVLIQYVFCMNNKDQTNK